MFQKQNLEDKVEQLIQNLNKKDVAHDNANANGNGSCSIRSSTPDAQNAATSATVSNLVKTTLL